MASIARARAPKIALAGAALFLCGSTGMSNDKPGSSPPISSSAAASGQPTLSSAVRSVLPPVTVAQPAWIAHLFQPQPNSNPPLSISSPFKTFTPAAALGSPIWINHLFPPGTAPARPAAPSDKSWFHGFDYPYLIVDKMMDFFSR